MGAGDVRLAEVDDQRVIDEPLCQGFRQVIRRRSIGGGLARRALKLEVVGCVAGARPVEDVDSWYRRQSVLGKPMMATRTSSAGVC